ncbi:alpha-2-macroglobulin family protein [Spirosoma koreense]
MHPFLTIFLILFTLAASAQNKPLPDYARDWRRADSLASKGLPKSAVEIVDRIYKEARAQKNYPQLAKAAIARTVYRAYSDEDAFKILIRSLRADIVETPEPAKSVLQSVLGDVYWQYFSQNRYKFYERTTVNTSGADNVTTSTDSTADFTTWDARQLVEAATTAYLASVRSRDALQKIPIGTYDMLLEKGDPDARPLRPTLYDLLAHRAIQFFQNTEPDLLKPVFRFELNQPAYFASPDVFARLTIHSQDSLSGRYQALLLYQQLLEFHLTDNHPNALVDADVLRLTFVHQHSNLPERDSLYRKALERQRNQYKNSPAEAVYAYQLAEFLTAYGPVRPPDDAEEATPSTTDPNRWNRKQAADICRELVSRYPETLAGKQAAQLLNQLLLPSYSFQIEQVNQPQQPFRALVSYQNVNKIRYRIIRITLTELQAYRENRADESQKRKWFSAWLKRPVIDESSVVLPDDGDLNRHSVEIPIKALPMGSYLLLATTNNQFQEKTEYLNMATFSISELSYLVLPATNQGVAQTVIVANRLTGEPLKNIAVSIVGISSKLPARQKSYRTDANGWVNIAPADLFNEPNFQYLIAHGADTVLSDRQYFYNGNIGRGEETAQSYVKLFTDRAIYRPGQAIYVKGLLYSGKTNAFAVVANQDVTIDFLDQNGEQLAEQTLKTNEFGTFSASFTAPVGRLTGEMSLQTAQGSTSIRVEEYKRPTFEVKVQPIRQAVKLGQTVTLKADAKTFSGAIVEGAAVRYRVVRRLRPRWSWWYMPRRTGQTEITNGTAQTDGKGNVSITFTATPDREQARETNPVFDFEVTIDVTDRAGETRSAAQTLPIGYSALQVSLVIPEAVEQDKPASFPIRITNQSGEKVSATGQLTVYRLQPPARLLRNRLWNRPDRQLISREEFEKLFPNDLYANENNPRFWPKGEAVQQLSVKAPADSLLKPDLSRYTPGEYVAELSVTDSLGETTREQVFFSVVNDRQPVASRRPEGWLQARKTTVEPGEEAVFWVGNSQPGWVQMMVEENHRFVRQEWLKTDGKPRRVALPVSEQQRGGFAVYFVMVQNGRMYQKSQTITVPFTNKQLTIETQTLRDKLKPGSREEWTLRVSGLAKTSAELVATLYDASLDAFDRLAWPTSFYQPYMPFFVNWYSGSFSVQPGYVFFYKPQPEIAAPTRQYDQLNWFGIRNDAIRISLVNDGKTISGTLKYKYGVGVAGASIIIKGTSTGTSTNAKGEFSVKIKPSQSPVTLLVSYIGYQTLEIAVSPGTMSSQMNPDAQALNEVVVTGYGRPGAVGPILASGRKGMARTAAASPMMMKSEATLAASGAAADKATNSTDEQPQTPLSPAISPRRNFNETAFFMPQLKTDEQGRVVLKFTMPEALTRWRLLAFAHTKDVKTGTLEREIVTQKELMITANAPRFFREGDTIQVQARLTNLSEKPLNDIKANLLLTNALTGELLVRPQLTSGRENETLAPGLSTAVGWTIVVPKGIELITCRLTAQSGLFTDGEEFTIPVLTNRMLITDSQPFWVNGKETKEFKLKPLTSLSPELPVQHERLTVEVTSNPSWYALQSLPYLMEYRYECAEQLFSRLYANSLAAHIVGSKPVFRQVIAEWQKNPAAKSPLQLNEELKAVTLENSPWLADARSEAERQAKLGQLLDANRMEQEQRLAFAKLEQLQTTDGGFRWFGGMQPDLAMTLHILSGFGHLQKLGVRFPDDLQTKIVDLQAKAIRYVDGEMVRWMKDQKKEQQKRKIVGAWYFSATQYLYARSFYLDKPVDTAVLSYLKQYVVADWQKQSLQGQALSALALHRFGDAQTSDHILRSLRERSRESDELGLYWPDNQSGLYWYQTPIETQAYLIEAFDEIKADRASVDKMKRWLLRQKQTQSWSSTKATTEAVYALLLRGSDWLGTGVTTQVSLGGQPIENRVTKADAITGYEKVTYAATEIKPEMGVIKVTKSTDGPAWGALYWQHFEPLDRVMAGSTGLSVQKTLTVQHDSPNGPIISPVTASTSLKPGDLIKVRLVLKTDRVMEYVHLKDSRASGFEPVAALSGYKYQNGLGYYESPRDASTDFFIGYLPVGTHVFEYDLRVAQTGDFSAGVATVQCFYAPEFSAHSAGERVKVK